MPREFRALNVPMTCVCRFVLFVLLASFANSASAQFITGVSIDSFSTELEAGFNRLAVETIDGSGFDEINLTHNNNASDMWLTNGTAFAPNDPLPVTPGFDPNPFIVYDLGNVYDLSSLSVWNYNEFAGGRTLSERGAKDVRISAGLTANALTPLDNGNNGDFVFAQADETNTYAGETFDLSGISTVQQVQFVRFDFFTNHVPVGNNNENFIGLSEVRFSPTVVIDNLNWAGTVDSNWDIETTANWTGDDTVFSQFDNVTFGDVTNKNVTINQNVIPSTVDFDGGASSTYNVTGSNGIIGAGSVTVTSGTVQLQNSGNNYSGATTISSGARLELNSASVGSVELQGTSTLSVGASGAAGEVVTANGDFTMAAGSTLELDISNTTADSATATGTATLSMGSNINVNYTDSSFPRSGFRYTLLSAAAVVGDINPLQDITLPPGVTGEFVNSTDFVVTAPDIYIPGVTIEQVSSELAGFGRGAENVVNGDGFIPNGGGTHTNTGSNDNDMWLSQGSFAGGDPDPVGGEDPPFLTFDLEGNFDLEAIDVWNYNEVNLTSRGANEVEIFVAGSLGGAFTSLGQFNLNQAPGNSTTDFGQIIDISTLTDADNVRLVRFEFLSNHGGDNDFVGLSEVRFVGVELQVDLFGDYNDDGTVDLADYTLWRNNLGAAAGTLPNDNTGQAIGTEQYDLWRANFGATANLGGTASNAVPEPSAIAMVGLALFGLVAMRHSRS